ncbi:MAG: peptidoglycan recognition protein family protein [Gammaproteobacteria bacterium]|nr:peptidoglycan recognition protein family protein [Gammaproteobacteria bacterium]
MDLKDFSILTFFLFSSTLFADEPVPVEFSWFDFDDWYYKKIEAYQGWKYIVLHHSATNAGSVNAFHNFHTEQGYGGIAYHFVIGNGNGMKDGEVKSTFRWEKQMSGTHVTVNSWEHNVFGIGICLVGNLETDPPTKAQMEALKQLVEKLKKQYAIDSKNIIGHKHVEYDDASGNREPTVCPGNKIDINELRV